MEVFKLWPTQVVKINILDRVDNEAIIEELHILHCLCPRNSLTPLEVTPEQFPALHKLRVEILSPIATDYIKQFFGVEPSSLEIDTFAKSFSNGEGLGAHLHGNSNLTSVYYPEDAEAGMTLYDPRLNASRGYPRPVRDTYFGDFHVAPKAGDLWLMPSFIMHGVEANPEDMRLSLINDFHFKV